MSYFHVIYIVDFQAASDKKISAVFGGNQFPYMNMTNFSGI